MYLKICETTDCLSTTLKMVYNMSPTRVIKTMYTVEVHCFSAEVIIHYMYPTITG